VVIRRNASEQDEISEAYPSDEEQQLGDPPLML
jgi:hypothetical protein